MGLAFYVLGVATGLLLRWWQPWCSQPTVDRPWIVVNGCNFTELEAACEFADWLEDHGHEIEFSVLKGSADGIYRAAN